MLLRDDETCISTDLFFPLVLFPSFLPQQPVYLPCLPALVSCFVSLLCFSILPLVLVVILSYIHIYTPVPTLALPKWVTLHLDLFVTLCCVIYHFRNNLSQTNHVCTSHAINNRLPSTCHTTDQLAEMACTFVPPPRKPNTTSS